MTSALLTPTHIAILLVIMLLLFGAKRLPEAGRATGRTMREFKEAITARDDVSAATNLPSDRRRPAPRRRTSITSEAAHSRSMGTAVGFGREPPVGRRSPTEAGGSPRLDPRRRSGDRDRIGNGPGVLFG